MGKGIDGVVLRDVHTLFAVGAVGGMTDDQLLDQFLNERGQGAEAAFGALVHRHGPMVLGICRRILPECQDSEDAFQATFLVLAKRARSIRNRNTIGPWLVGVARKVASRVRNNASRRRAFERRAAKAVVCELPETLTSFDEIEVLLQEVDRLPGRLRDPVMLFYLQGQSYEQAARSLGTTEGTIRGRLARARESLRTRLAGRGVSASLVSPWTLTSRIAEALPCRLVASTIRSSMRLAAGESLSSVASTSVTTLMEGVVKSMGLNHLKTSGLLALASGIFALGVGMHVHAQQKPDPRPTAEPPKEVARDDSRSELAALPELAGGRIVRSAEVKKDGMILSYLPDWGFGNVDNIGLANNDGGVRTLVDWTDVTTSEAKSSQLKFYLAFYSRKTTAKPKPGSIVAFDVTSEWSESTSWKTRPSYEPEPVLTAKFEPGDGWKLFDITSIVREHEGKSGQGLMFRFFSEDRPGSGDWSGYQFVSREGKGEWAKRRPQLLVVEPIKK